MEQRPAVRSIEILLKITSVVNVLAGVGMILLALAGIFPFQFSISTGMDARTYVTVWVFVAVMGVGYGMASRDPERQTALILAGGLGKIAAAMIWLECVVHGLAAGILAFASAFDGTLGVLFTLFALSRAFKRAG